MAEIIYTFSVNNVLRYLAEMIEHKHDNLKVEINNEYTHIRYFGYDFMVISHKQIYTSQSIESLLKDISKYTKDLGGPTYQRIQVMTLKEYLKSMDKILLDAIDLHTKTKQKYARYIEYSDN